MAAYAYPTSDVDNSGSWTTAPLYAKVDEEPYSDSDYVTSPKSAASKAFTVGLGSVGDPGVHTGHVLRVRAYCSGSSGTMKFELLQSTTVIKDSGTLSLTTSFAEYSLALTEAEAANISDYTALRVRYTAITSGTNKYQYVSWIRLEVPAVPKSVSDSGTGSDSPTAKGLVSAADSGSGTDHMAGLAATVPAADSGAGLDSVAAQERLTVLPKSVADSGGGADGPAEVRARLGATDTGTGGDVLSSILARIGVTDAGAGHEALEPRIKLDALGDLGTGIDTGSVARFDRKSVADAGAGAEVLAILARIVASDSGTGADLQEVRKKLEAVLDASSGADAVSAKIPRAVSDAGFGADDPVVPKVQVAVIETAAGGEVLAVLVRSSVADAGAGSDEVGRTEPAYPKSVIDQGGGTDDIAGIRAGTALRDAGAGFELVLVGRGSTPIAVQDRSEGADFVFVDPKGRPYFAFIYDVDPREFVREVKPRILIQDVEPRARIADVKPRERIVDVEPRDRTGDLRRVP